MYNVDAIEGGNAGERQLEKDNLYDSLSAVARSQPPPRAAALSIGEGQVRRSESWG